MSACRDGHVHSWAFKAGKLQRSLHLGCELSKATLHPHSMLAALACADSVVRVIDIERACIVRQFRGHTARITDVCVSADARWVLSGDADGVLRVWDVPTAACLQAMAMGVPIVALSLSPGMEFLATAHAGQRGISLWSNRLLFSGHQGTLLLGFARWIVP
jgi:U3 small nucleolar RNA-associated protein 21